MKKKAPSKKPTYSISLKLGSEVYSSSGETALEALSSLPKPAKIFLKGVLTISKGESKHEMLMYPTKIKRLFYPLCRNLLAKQLTLLAK